MHPKNHARPLKIEMIHKIQTPIMQQNQNIKADQGLNCLFTVGAKWFGDFSAAMFKSDFFNITVNR